MCHFIRNEKNKTGKVARNDEKKGEKTGKYSDIK
jgi:hypothetical protein